MRDNNLSTTFIGGCHVVTDQGNDVSSGSFVYIYYLRNYEDNSSTLSSELSGHFD